jgi:hypothetical protein
MSMPLFGEFTLGVNQNQDFWYEEAIEEGNFKCGDNPWDDDRCLLDVREIGTSFVVPVVNFADYANCWWRQASNIQAIDSAGDASSASAHNISATFISWYPDAILSLRSHGYRCRSSLAEFVFVVK